MKSTDEAQIDETMLVTIKASDLNILKLILRAGLIDFKSASYQRIRNLLVFACQIGNLSIIEELFSQAGLQNERIRLIIAFLSKNDEIFINFLNRGFVNRSDDGSIKWLVEGYRPKLIQTILEKGANSYEEPIIESIYSDILDAIPTLNSRLTHVETPVVTALLHSRIKSMEVFLEQGFSPNHRIFSGNSTLLHLACDSKFLLIIF